MNKKTLYFIGPQEVEIRNEEIAEPNEDEVLIKTKFSSISAGTELLFFNNNLKDQIKLDKKITSLENEFEYPLKYGYSVVGKIKEIGENLSEKWLDKKVFSFHPHESHFVSKPDELVIIPNDIEYKKAVFLPNTETALNLLLDGAPKVGEEIGVIGQGVVGLLTTYLLNEMPLSRLVTFDKIKKRREISSFFGADESISFEELKENQNLFDLVFEVSGNPETLEKAIELTKPEGKIILGSWYGEKGKTRIGTAFHRKRLKLISSQVSSINPEISNRWSKERRLETALQFLKDMDLSKLITDKVNISEAERVYEKLNQRNKDTIQVIFEYS